MQREVHGSCKRLCCRYVLIGPGRGDDVHELLMQLFRHTGGAHGRQGGETDVGKLRANNQTIDQGRRTNYRRRGNRLVKAAQTVIERLVAPTSVFLSP
jgi:hypothetical protein